MYGYSKLTKWIYYYQFNHTLEIGISLMRLIVWLSYAKNLVVYGDIVLHISALNSIAKRINTIIRFRPSKSICMPAFWLPKSNIEDFENFVSGKKKKKKMEVKFDTQHLRFKANVTLFCIILTCAGHKSLCLFTSIVQHLKCTSRMKSTTKRFSTLNVIQPLQSSSYPFIGW